MYSELVMKEIIEDHRLRGPSMKNEPAFYRNLEQALDSRRRGQYLLGLKPRWDDTVADFTTCDFLSLSRSGQVREAFLAEVAAHPGFDLAASGSRIQYGNYSYLNEVEQEIAEFHGVETVYITQSGFAANVGILSGVPLPGDAILYDELVHASTHEGLHLSLAEHKLPFSHNNPDALREVLVSLKGTQPAFAEGTRSVLICVESIYSMDGDVCLLEDLLQVTREEFPLGNAQFVVDEAHSLGVIGNKGRGLVSMLGLEKDIAIRIHVASKAIGSVGVHQAQRKIQENVRHFFTAVTSNATWVEASAAGIVYIPLLEGWEGREFQTHIVPLRTQPLHEQFLFHKLLVNNINAYPMAFPVVPKGGSRVRLVFHAHNTAEQIDKLAATICEWAREILTVGLSPAAPLKMMQAEQAGPSDADAATVQPSLKPRKPVSFYMSILALGLLSLITSWDATSLAIALPTITQELHGTTLLSFWANVSFTLAVAITQPIYVSVSDVFGRKQPLYASMALFIIGTVLFATANTMSILVAGRLIQGLGAGGLDVLEEIILADITTLKERPLYLGLLAIAIALGTISGPVIGALFSEFANWRWIGWINLPIVGLAFLLCYFFLNLRPIPIGLGTKIRRLDWIGILLFATGSTASSLPLSWAGALYAWSSWRTIVPLVIGFVFLVIFGFYERKPVEAIMPYRIFSNTTATFSLITGFIHGLILYTLLQYLPLYFQAVFLESPLEAAKSTLPVAILVVAFSFVAPVIVELTRRYRILLWLGWSFTTVFLGLWCLVDETIPRVRVYVFEALLGVGVGTVFTGTQIPMQASVKDVDDTGLAVGMLVAFRLFGALVGLAIGSTAFTSEFQKSSAGLLKSMPEESRVLEDVSQAISFIPELITSDLPEESIEVLVGAYNEAFRAVWIVMTVLSGLGFIGSLFIKEHTLEKDEIGRQGLEQS
ncbi:hypothetical protein DL769_003377 [Monosporascus sp. CRB-8-3]|nr:hypothetical protein DL769_003377 [Monosporascus sp. CRB-8-3]